MTNELDARAVAAVQQGDRERYRELVERHADKVYAVAWCRLGDRDLAEEAAQEAFIKAFRHLGFLKSGAKFGSWIAAIARNLATNLGLRHRRELARRERWALSAVEPDHAPEKETTSVETLREALAELPPAHRECLVLFYLEGKSITESAALLDLSEAAFKTRLHRARAALRVALEARLENSLRELRPSRQLLPGIMAALPPEPLGAAAGGLAGLALKAATGLGKLVPAAFLISLLPFLGMAVGFLASGWAARRQAKNYREPEGFRARLFKSGVRKNISVLLLILAGMAVIRGVAARWDVTGLMAGLGLLALFGIYAAWNMAKIQTPAKAWGFAAAMFCQFTGIAGVEFFELPTWFAWYGFGSFALLLAFTQRTSWPRMDEGLFLRAAVGLLPPPVATPDAPRAASQNELKAFARFLGTRLLITDRRCGDNHMDLRLAELRPSIPRGLCFFYWDRSSQARIHHDGRVEARRGERDAATLAEMGLPTGDEAAVAGALRSALGSFRAGDIAGAEKCLGQRPGAEIYHRPPEQTAFIRFGRWFQIGLGVLLLGLATYSALSLPEPVRRLRPVQAGAVEINRAIRHAAEATRARDNTRYELDWLLRSCWILPPKEFLEEQTQRALADAVREETRAVESVAKEYQSSAADSLLGAPGIWYQLFHGWIDLATPPLDQMSSHTIQGYLERHFTARLRLAPLTQLKENEYSGDAENLRVNLRLLQRFGRLDLVDQPGLARDLAARQILPRQPATTTLLKRYRGLFHLAGRNPVEDTCVTLTSLDVIGALHTIDREECIAGLLRLHHGQGAIGYFPREGRQLFSEAAKNTYCAFESLRLLGALDRVKDLDRWEFRVDRNPRNKSSATGERVLLQNEIEAWAAREYFRQVLNSRRADPATTL